MLSSFKKLLGLDRTVELVVETPPPEVAIVPELPPVNEEPVITECVDTNLLNTASAMMALKENTATDGQKLKVLFDLKKILQYPPAHTKRAKNEYRPQEIQHDITGQHAIRLLLTMSDEQFVERIMCDKKTHACYIKNHQADNQIIKNALSFYQATFNACDKGHITPQIVQEAYHLFFPQPDDVHYSTEKNHTPIKGLIFDNLLKKKPDGLQSFMVDHLFSCYTNEKNSDVASYYASHIQHIFSNRPETISAEHINTIPTGHNTVCNFELLTKAFQKKNTSQTPDLMNVYLDMTNELVMTSTECFTKSLPEYSALQKEKGSNLDDYYLSSEQISIKSDYNNKKSSVENISRHYRNSVRLFLEKNTNDTLDETILTKLQPDANMTEALIMFENVTGQKTYRPSEDTASNPNPRVTPMEIFIEELRIAGVYGEEARIEQIHLNTLRVYTS